MHHANLKNAFFYHFTRQLNFNHKSVLTITMLLYFDIDDQIKLFKFQDYAVNNLEKIVEFDSSIVSENEWSFCGEKFEQG